MLKKYGDAKITGVVKPDDLTEIQKEQLKKAQQDLEKKSEIEKNN